MRRARSIITTGAMTAFLLAAGPASALTFVVNSIGDPGTGACDAAECTFREALTAANSGGVRDDTIAFAVTGSNISALGTPFPTIQSAATQGALSIEGPGADKLAIRRSFGNFGMLSNSIGANTTIKDLTITGGSTSAGAGGGIFNFGTLLLDRVAVVDNTANGGGGINNDNNASLTVRRSLIADNKANPLSQGAGIYSIGTLVIDRSTITGNRLLGTGGSDFAPGVFAAGPSTTITGSTIAGNSGPNTTANIVANTAVTLDNTIIANPIQLPSGTAVNCSGTIVSAGHNLADDNSCALTATGDRPGVNPQLGALADNGGPTKTLAIPAASPAVDAGLASPSASDDQRGLPRPADIPAVANVADGSDIGAFELQPPPPGGPGGGGGGGGGGDTATCSGRTATITGTGGVDRLVGTAGDDVIAALAGDDVVNGGGGKDLICGGDGKDKLKGGAGRDRLLGEAGKDRLSGGGGTDTLVGGPGKDRCRKGGKDRLSGC